MIKVMQLSSLHSNGRRLKYGEVCQMHLAEVRAIRATIDDNDLVVVRDSPNAGYPAPDLGEIEGIYGLLGSSSQQKINIATERVDQWEAMHLGGMGVRVRLRGAQGWMPLLAFNCLPSDSHARVQRDSVAPTVAEWSRCYEANKALWGVNSGTGSIPQPKLAPPPARIGILFEVPEKVVKKAQKGKGPFPWPPAEPYFLMSHEGRPMVCRETPIPVSLASARAWDSDNEECASNVSHAVRKMMFATGWDSKYLVGVVPTGNLTGIDPRQNGMVAQTFVLKSTVVKKFDVPEFWRVLEPQNDLVRNGPSGVIENGLRGDGFITSPLFG